MAKKKGNRKRRIQAATATSVAVASFGLNSQLEAVVRADDQAGQDTALVTVVEQPVVEGSQPELLTSEAVVLPAEGTFGEPESVDPETVSTEPPSLPLEQPGLETEEVLEKASLISEPEPLPEQPVELVNQEGPSPSIPVESEATSVEQPLTEVPEPDRPNQEAQELSWRFQGLGDREFGQLTYSQATGQLQLQAEGRPHLYFKDQTYVEVNVNRAGQDLLNQTFLGQETYRQVSESGLLQAGDRLTVFHAEPNRLQVSDPVLKTKTVTAKTFVYEVERDLSLRNVTDAVILDRHLSALFVDDSRKGLAFGTDGAAIDRLERQLQDEDLAIDPAERARFQGLVAEARTLLSVIPWDLPVNSLMTKDMAVLPTAIIASTEAESRPLGTKHDRQDLGLILQKGSELRIRQANPDFKDSLTLRFLGDDSRIESQLDFGRDWVSLRALGDVAVFVDTPVTDQAARPVLAYEVVAGAAKTLPTFTYGDQQEAFIDTWDKTKSPYALIKAHNIHLLVPYLDLPVVKERNLEQLITGYDQKVFGLIDALTGLPSNTADTHVKGVYFAKANNNGVGAAYYSRTHTAQTAASMAAYLDLGWLPVHEIAHGYEVPSTRMPIVDVFNNLYGTFFQARYLANPQADSWIYEGNQAAWSNRLVDIYRHQGLVFGERDRRTDLLTLLSLVSLAGEEGFAKFNSYHREQAMAGRQVSDLGALWAEFFAKDYQLDVTPFFETIKMPLPDLVKQAIAQSGASPVAMLAQLVPEDQLDWAMTRLGWDQEFLRTKISLVPPSDLAKLGLTSQVQLNLTSPEELRGSELRLMSGRQLVRQLRVTDGILDLGELPNGIYTLEHDNDQVKVDQPYLYVGQSGQESRVLRLSPYLPSLEALYQDDYHQALKPETSLQTLADLRSQLVQLEDAAVRQANQDLLDKAYHLITQWDLTGLGNAPFAAIRYLNQDMVLRLDSLGKAPHSYFSDQYAKVVVQSASGDLVYEKVYLGNQRPSQGTELIPLEVGSRLMISHREPNRLLASPASLVSEKAQTQSYEVTATGRLRPLGNNSGPEIVTLYQDLVVRQDPTGHIQLLGETGQGLDLTSLAKAYDADDGELPIGPAQVETDLDVGTPRHYSVTYKVTDRDGVTATKTIAVRVVATVAPLGQDQVVDKHQVLDPRLSVANLAELPSTASLSFKDELDTSLSGVLEAVVLVTIDNDQYEVPVKIRIREDAERYVPVGKRIDLEYGQALDPKLALVNLDQLPEGTQVTWGQGLDVTRLGHQIVELVLTYPDGSRNTTGISVVVKPAPDPVVSVPVTPLEEPTPGPTQPPVAEDQLGPRTKFVDESGHDLRLALLGSHPDVSLEGYELLYRLTDAEGNLTLVYGKTSLPVDTEQVEPTAPSPVPEVLPAQPIPEEVGEVVTLPPTAEETPVLPSQPEAAEPISSPVQPSEAVVEVATPSPAASTVDIPVSSDLPSPALPTVVPAEPSQPSPASESVVETGTADSSSVPSSADVMVISPSRPSKEASALPSQPGVAEPVSSPVQPSEVVVDVPTLSPVPPTVDLPVSSEPSQSSPASDPVVETGAVDNTSLSPIAEVAAVSPSQPLAEAPVLPSQAEVVGPVSSPVQTSEAVVEVATPSPATSPVATEPSQSVQSSEPVAEVGAVDSTLLPPSAEVVAVSPSQPEVVVLTPPPLPEVPAGGELVRPEVRPVEGVSLPVTSAPQGSSLEIVATLPVSVVDRGNLVLATDQPSVATGALGEITGSSEAAEPFSRTTAQSRPTVAEVAPIARGQATARPSASPSPAATDSGKASSTPAAPVAESVTEATQEAGDAVAPGLLLYGAALGLLAAGGTLIYRKRLF